MTRDYSLPPIGDPAPDMPERSTLSASRLVNDVVRMAFPTGHGDEVGVIFQERLGEFPGPLRCCVRTRLDGFGTTEVHIKWFPEGSDPEPDSVLVAAAYRAYVGIHARENLRGMS